MQMMPKKRPPKYRIDLTWIRHSRQEKKNNYDEHLPELCSIKYYAYEMKWNEFFGDERYIAKKNIRNIYDLIAQFQMPHGLCK